MLYDCEIKGDLENAVRGVDHADDPAGDGKCKLLWIETPSNLHLARERIFGAAAACRARVRRRAVLRRHGFDATPVVR